VSKKPIESFLHIFIHPFGPHIDAVKFLSGGVKCAVRDFSEQQADIYTRLICVWPLTQMLHRNSTGCHVGIYVIFYYADENDIPVI
jgi:hypothetical protein